MHTNPSYLASVLLVLSSAALASGCKPPASSARDRPAALQRGDSPDSRSRAQPAISDNALPRPATVPVQAVVQELGGHTGNTATTRPGVAGTASSRPTTVATGDDLWVERLLSVKRLRLSKDKEALARVDAMLADPALRKSARPTVVNHRIMIVNMIARNEQSITRFEQLLASQRRPR
jgi:hypothetical protein